jgi:hypothetical protein
LVFCNLILPSLTIKTAPIIDIVIAPLIAVHAETLADPYKGKIPLARVKAFQEPFASHQVIQQDTPNNRRANQCLKHTETCMKYSFPPIATECSHLFLILFIAVTPFLSSFDRD